MTAEKRPRRRKPGGYIDINPTLKKPVDNPVTEDATGVAQSRADYAIRLGLGDPDQIYYYRQCLMDPERAVQNPQLRRYVAETLERALRLIFDDAQMWNRAQQLLRRRYPNQVASGLSEAAYNVLRRRAERRGCDFEAVMEAWSRGLHESGPDAAYQRAVSFIDGGHRDDDLRESFTLSASHPSGDRGRGAFYAKAGTHHEVRRKIASVRRSYPEHQVSVTNHSTGRAHTFKPRDDYDERVLESDSNRDVLGKIRRALEKK